MLGTVQYQYVVLYYIRPEYNKVVKYYSVVLYYITVEYNRVVHTVLQCSTLYHCCLSGVQVQAQPDGFPALIASLQTGKVLYSIVLYCIITADRFGKTHTESTVLD